jgi:hypothetical protein
MDPYVLEGQLGFSLTSGNQSICLKVGELHYIGTIDSETFLFIRLTETGMLAFFVGKQMRDLTSLYS